MLLFQNKTSTLRGEISTLTAKILSDWSSVQQALTGEPPEKIRKAIMEVNSGI